MGSEKPDIQDIIQALKTIINLYDRGFFAEKDQPAARIIIDELVALIVSQCQRGDK